MPSLSVLIEDHKVSSEIIEIDFANKEVLKEHIEHGKAFVESIIPCKIKIKNEFKLVLEKE